MKARIELDDSVEAGLKDAVSAVSELALSQTVKTALANVIDGTELDRYFGITSRQPVQAPAEALGLEALAKTLQREDERRFAIELLTSPVTAPQCPAESLRSLIYGRGYSLARDRRWV